MADEVKQQVETTNVQADETAKQPETTETVSVAKAEYEKLQAALKDANKEAMTRRKRLEELEAAEQKRKEAEMTESEKLQKRLAELEAKTKGYERAELQRKVAEKVGLPAALAGRLVGESEEQIEADAKSLLETLPKPETKTPQNPGPVVTNPNGGSTGETDAQRRKRLNM